MPRRTVVYKVDIRDVEETLALNKVLDMTEMVTAITLFAKTFSLPVDDAEVNTHMVNFAQIKQAIEQAEKGKKK